MEMNKIVVEQKELTLINEDVLITNILEKEVIINIKGNVICGFINLPSECKITINLNESSNLQCDFFVQLKNVTNQIHINSNESSKLNLNYACTFEGENHLSIYNDVNSNNTENNIYVRTVEIDGTLDIVAEGYIREGTKSSVYLEDIKALTNKNNSVKIMPNLLVKTNSVIANHNATISNINEQELFYLGSKGINKENAIKLIKNGFLKGILSINELKVGGEIPNE